MRVNEAYLDYALGTILAAESFFVGDFPYNFFIYYYIEVGGNHTAAIRSDGDLSVSNVVKGTVTFSSYASSTNRTRIYYTPVAGTFVVGDSVVADGGPASMEMVAHNFFRAPYDYHASNFSICGGLDVETEVSVDVEVRMGIFNTAYKGVPWSVPSDDWDGDQVFGMEGLMMGVR